MSGPRPKVIIDVRQLTAKEIFDLLVVELGLDAKDSTEPGSEGADDA